MVCRGDTTQHVLYVCHVYFHIQVFHLCFKCCSQVLHGVSQMWHLFFHTSHYMSF